MYQQLIRECAARLGRVGVDGRHIEAWMRSEHGTLDGLGPRRFRDEVEVAIALIDRAGTEQSEALARSFGL
jgi:hypothetical protein